MIIQSYCVMWLVANILLEHCFTCRECSTIILLKALCTKIDGTDSLNNSDAFWSQKFLLTCWQKPMDLPLHKLAGYFLQDCTHNCAQSSLYSHREIHSGIETSKIISVKLVGLLVCSIAQTHQLTVAFRTYSD